MPTLLSRIIQKTRRTSANIFGRRLLEIRSSVPIISFTFDDAPKTAFTVGGDILRSHGARATYYVSLGLLERQTEVGIIASADDLIRAVAEGSEIGCHTYDHWDTWQTRTQKYMESVIRNRKALGRILPGTEFRTFAYPISEPKPVIKRQLEKYFICCRGGGQIPNVGIVDLNRLNAYFLDRRHNLHLNEIKLIIDHNISRNGWLIFATHDIDDNPSPFGCTPQLFENVVAYAAHSGALILTVRQACELIYAEETRRLVCGKG